MPNAVRIDDDRIIPAPCRRCTGVGAHFLTCPDLRLPAGFDFIADDPEPARRGGPRPKMRKLGRLGLTAA